MKLSRISDNFNKIFAKLGSDIKKPDAVTVINKDNFKETIWKLPVNDLLYVGKATHNKLKTYGIKTIGDLANTDVKYLEYAFGKNGIMLWNFANGYDYSPVTNIGAKSLIKSVGNSCTTVKDLITDEQVKITFYSLCESVSARLREYGFKCSTIQITIRDNELFSYERQTKTNIPTCTTNDMFEKAFYLYKTEHRNGKPIRSLGVRACNLSLDDYTQLSMFPEIIKSQKDETIDRTIDTIRNRFGYFSIQRGIMLTDKELSNIDAKSEHIIHPISFLA